MSPGVLTCMSLTVSHRFVRWVFLTGLSFYSVALSWPVSSAVCAGLASRVGEDLCKRV